MYSTDESCSLSGIAAQRGLLISLGDKTYTALEAEITSSLSAVSFAPVSSFGTVVGTLIMGYSLADEAIVDQIKGITGDDVTIFQDGTRINTTIRQDGQRTVGTRAEDAVLEAVLEKGSEYSGALTIAGEPYVAHYRPLKNPEGDAVGILFSGVSQKAVENALNEMILFFAAIAAAALALLIVGMTLFTRRAINRPLEKLLVSARQIARGDLSEEVTVRSRDEIGELADAFRQMSGNLSDMIGGINTAASQITEGARQVSLSSVALATGAKEQASAIEEFTSSLEEISAQTTRNADRADEANSLSREALSKAQEGNRQMQPMLGAMREIDSASESIAKIIRVIDDIAFQTNILALNAAVEAARAGEHGKGFAVVTEEVRSLAARSAEAAKETTSSIGKSIREVEKGARIADATAAMLDSIVVGVSKTVALVSDIALACSEQVTAIGQMNLGINRIMGAMQANSATSQENSAASEELSSQAESMKPRSPALHCAARICPRYSRRTLAPKGEAAPACGSRWIT